MRSFRKPRQAAAAARVDISPAKRFRLTVLIYCFTIFSHHQTEGLKMAATLAKAGPSTKWSDGLATQIFGRVMAWTCLALAILMIVAAAGGVKTTIAVSSGGLTACGQGAGSIGARPCVSGGMTMISQVLYAADGHVISRKPLASTPPDLRRWSPGNIASLFAAVPPLLLALALWQGSRFFAGLGSDRIFHAATVRRLRNFSILGVAFLLSDTLLEPLVNAALGLFGRESVRFQWPFMLFSSPHGHSAWALSGAGVMQIVFLGALIAMVSVLARAAKLAEDHAQIV
jgi:hypothetical protein